MASLNYFASYHNTEIFIEGASESNVDMIFWRHKFVALHWFFFMAIKVSNVNPTLATMSTGAFLAPIGAVLV